MNRPLRLAWGHPFPRPDSWDEEPDGPEPNDDPRDSKDGGDK
jgi:hypothetical protein